MPTDLFTEAACCNCEVVYDVAETLFRSLEPFLVEGMAENQNPGHSLVTGVTYWARIFPQKNGRASC